MTRPQDQRLLLVHAHPDDESAGTAGVIARAVADGRRVDLVVCTGGEEGEVHDPDLDPDEARPRLRDIRMSELACSVRALAGDAPHLRLELLGYRDSGMMGTESNNHPDCFWQADLAEATRRLVGIVRRAKPSVLVGYDDNGGYGHPDHIQAHRVAVAAFDAAADPSAFPGEGPPHAIEKLYEVAFNRDEWFGLMVEMRRRGIPLPWGMDEQLGEQLASAGGTAPPPAADGESDPPAEAKEAAAEDAADIEDVRAVSWEVGAGVAPEDFGTADADITTRVDVSAHLDAKRASMDCHRTQRQDLGWLLELPDDLVDRAMATEWFVLRRWRGRDVDAGARETDLFEGLSAPA
ncbi:MAG: PIG-L family deacetylase [Chloroflexota bacterium]|nr:PIG-L family deacetylase [Chloroflexota bacterium]